MSKSLFSLMHFFDAEFGVKKKKKVFLVKLNHILLLTTKEPKVKEESLLFVLVGLEHILLANTIICGSCKISQNARLQLAMLGTLL